MKPGDGKKGVVVELHPLYPHVVSSVSHAAALSAVHGRPDNFDGSICQNPIKFRKHLANSHLGLANWPASSYSV